VDLSVEGMDHPGAGGIIESPLGGGDIEMPPEEGVETPPDEGAETPDEGAETPPDGGEW
jgi:hypothetical protein